MNDRMEPLRLLAELAAEGTRLFGDDPERIGAHIETALARRPRGEREELRRALAMLAARPASERSH